MAGVAFRQKGRRTLATPTAANTKRVAPKRERGRVALISNRDRSEIEQIYEAFRQGSAKLVGADGNSRLLPESLGLFLAELIGQLSRGKSVTIVRNQATLTTLEAANTLGVSRQFLVNLLERGEIAFHMVGTHRRIYAQDLLVYKAARDKGRHKSLCELAVAEAKDGLYEINPCFINTH